MRHRVVLISLPLLVLFLALAPTAVASSTWYVDGVNGNDNNDCKSAQTACKTIGHAISLASSGDSIMVAAATYTENLTIGFSLKVIGSGATTTIIDGGGVNTVVTISSSTAHVTLSRLTIWNGMRYSKAGGISNSGTLTINNIVVRGNSGSGIYNSGTATVNNSTVRGNGSLNGGLVVGGGIWNVGTLAINNSTINGNVGTEYGGGIDNGGTLTIDNSTISGNSAVKFNKGHYSWGGGIWNDGTLTIDNSTISGNGAVFGGGIYNYGGTLGINNSTLSENSTNGIYNLGGATAVLQNSILAKIASGGNCYGTVASNGYNLSDDGSCNFNGPGDLNNTDPVLGPLQNNGGPTQTQALLSGSPAIDSGNPSGCTDSQGHLLKTDQRGKPRPDHEDTGGCDMGAYERQSD